MRKFMSFMYGAFDRYSEEEALEEMMESALVEFLLVPIV